MFSSHDYAHEFGHILGLHDNYIEMRGPDGRPTSVLAPGAADDIMYRGATVDPSTMTRMIRRSTLDPKQLKCPITWDLPKTTLYNAFGYLEVAVHAWACDYDPPSNAPGSSSVIIFNGTITLGGKHKIPIFGGAEGSGTESFTTTYKVGDPEIQARMSTGIIVAQAVDYEKGGLISMLPVALIGPGGQLAMNDQSVFTLKAAECQ